MAIEKKTKKTTSMKPLNREPKDAVAAAKTSMGAEIESGVNKEIKDIVNDILKGNIKKAMNYKLGDNAKGGESMGIKENKKNIKECDTKKLSEKELILGGKKEEEPKVEEPEMKEGEIYNSEKAKYKFADNTSKGKDMGISEEEHSEDDEEHDAEGNDITPDGDEDDMNLEGEELDFDNLEENDEIELPEYQMNLEGEDETEEDPLDAELNLDGSEEPTEDGEGSELADAPMSEPTEEIPAEEPDADAPMGDEPDGDEAPISDEPTEDGEEDVSLEIDKNGDQDNIEIESTNYEDMADKDKEEVDGYMKEAEEFKKNFENELKGIEESVMPKNVKEKIGIIFEMAVKAKANAEAKKKTATVINKVNDYMKYIVKEYVQTKNAEIKEAIDASKKVELYENFKGLVENLYGSKATSNINEAKKTQDFLVNSISEQKKLTEALEQKLNEANEKVREMECVLLFTEATKAMTVTDKDRIADFVSTFEFKNVADFKSKLSIVMEQFKSLKNENKVAPKKINKIDENKIKAAIKNKKEVAVKEEINENVNNNNDADVIDPEKFNFNIIA